MKLALLVLVSLLAVVSAKVYLKETFDDSWQSRWVDSDWKKNDGTQGKWKHTAGEFYGDAEKDKGIQTSEDARFYAISSKFEKFSNEGKDLVIQFQVRFPQNIDCGGGYIKILPSTTELKNFRGGEGESKYNIMFGPDICGTSTKRVHVIFNNEGKNILIKKTINAETDKLSHVYTLIVHSDDSYEVRVDGVKRESGKLADDWEFTAPRTIKDPNAKKPADWVDKAKIDDPSDTKPADWESIPKEIPDPEATKPDDWDDEADGSWEAPTIPNPEYKGEWKARQIDNPDYKGPWVHPEIANPDYKEKTDLYKYDDFGVVGIDIWQVKAGTIFDNIFISDSVKESEDFLAETYGASKDKEKEMLDNKEKVKRDEEEEERKRVESEKKKQEDNKSGDDDEDDEEEESSNDDAAEKLKEKIIKEEL